MPHRFRRSPSTSRSKMRFVLRGKGVPQGKTDARGDFAVANVPDGKFFVHVTPGPNDTEHLPGGDPSRRRSRPTIAWSLLHDHAFEPSVHRLPVPGSSDCLTCHKDQEHWNQTAHKLGWTVPGEPGPMQDFSRHPEYFEALASFPSWTATRAARASNLGTTTLTGRRQVQASSIWGWPRAYRDPVCRCISVEEFGGHKYYISMVNRIDPGGSQ